MPRYASLSDVVDNHPNPVPTRQEEGSEIYNTPTFGRRSSPRSISDGLSNIPLQSFQSYLSSERTPVYSALGNSSNASDVKDRSSKPFNEPILIETEYKGLRSLTDILSPDDASTAREPPKTAIRRGLRANLAKLLPHVVAISVTIAVVQLSWRNHYWMDLLPPAQHIAPGVTQGAALNFLQLAAKIHELIILASLSSIVLHAVQSHLLGSGLPMGMIANSFYLGSGEFIRRKAFWTAWWGTRSNEGQGTRFAYTRFWLLSLVCTLLVTLSGPASAIAILPDLTWFPIFQPFDTVIPPYFVYNHSTELWPSHVSGDSLNSPNSGNPCTSPTSFYVDACPAGGFRDTYAWAGNLFFTDTDLGTNISFTSAVDDTRRVLTTRSCATSFTGRASAMSLNDFFSGALTTFWSFAQRNYQGLVMNAVQPKLVPLPSTEIFAPRVEVVCSTYFNYNSTGLTNQPAMQFPILPGDTSSTPQTMKVPEWSYVYERPKNASNFTWVELPRTASGPSIGAVLTVPLIERINYVWKQESENLACSIYGQWVPVDAWYEPNTADQVAYSLANPLPDTCLNLPSSNEPDRVPRNFSLGQAYADAINQELDFVTGNMPAIYAILQQFIVPDDVKVPNGVLFNAPIPGLALQEITDETARRSRARLVATVLAGVVTDGLARIAGDGLWPYTSPMFVLNRTAPDLVGNFPIVSAYAGQHIPLNTSAASVDDWLELSPIFERFGYGYRWNGSPTAQFGISVLIVHVILAVVHVGFVLHKVLVRGEGIGRSWDTVNEMLALAMNSQPTRKLQNTCAGIELNSTWQEVVSVRETTAGHLEMVVGERARREHGIPLADHLYGTLRDEALASGRETRGIMRRMRRGSL